MSKHECDCCRVYGPIPREGLTKEERRAIRKETQEAMEKFRLEDPEGFKKLGEMLAKETSGR